MVATSQFSRLTFCASPRMRQNRFLLPFSGLPVLKYSSMYPSNQGGPRRTTIRGRYPVYSNLGRINAAVARPASERRRALHVPIPVRGDFVSIEVRVRVFVAMPHNGQLPFASPLLLAPR